MRDAFPELDFPSFRERATREALSDAARMPGITQRDIDRHQQKNPRDPLIVALWGGPGTGKSTFASGVFYQLKMRGRNVEFVHEVAKDLTWEQRHFALSHQQSLAGKQMRAYDRLYGKVECIVTDTSTLLGLIHSKPTMKAYDEFSAWLVADWKARNTLNIFLNRDTERPYNPNGRRQSQASAEAMDGRISTLLRAHNVKFECEYVCDGEVAVKRIADLVEKRLAN